MAQDAATAPAAATPVQAAPAPVQPAPVAPRVMPQLSAAQTAQLRAMLDGAAAHGMEAAAPKDDAKLAEAALSYARAVRAGQLAPGEYLEVWAMRPAAYDPFPAFAKAVADDRLASWIASLPPPYAGYDGLRKGLSRYRVIAANGGWRTLPAGPDITLSSRGPRVAALRQRLAVEDKNVTATGDVFDQALLDSVRRAQRRYGLNPTGVVSTQTTAALNVPVSRRVEQIVANMERWRWMPAELDARRVQVNIAAAVLTVFEGDKPVASMRGVTGRPGGDETPMLSSEIHSVVVNPPWNVPASIAKEELFPKGSAYLKANGFKVIETPEGGKRLQQAAGDQSALGRLKFDFLNPFAVYLHDTPAKAKFSSFDRLASHGCVRVEKPVELARLLFKDDPKWGAPGAIEEAIATNKTQRVPLTRPVTVYLFYWTAFATGEGAVSFRDDPYKWDSALAAKLDGGPARLAAR